MTNLSVESSRVVDVRTGHKLMGCDWGRNEGHFRYRHEGRVFVRSSVQKTSRKQQGGILVQTGGHTRSSCVRNRGHTRNNHASSLDHPRSSHARSILFLFNRKIIVVGDQCHQKSDSSYSLNKIISYLSSLFFGLVEAGKSQPGVGVPLT